jgi:hypothetical protein
MAERHIEADPSQFQQTESPTVTKSLPGVIPAQTAAPAPKLPAQNVLSGGSVNARTKALLEAVATGGKRGLESYQQSETAINDYRKQALGRTSALAALVGGPEAQGFEKIADQQYGARLTDLDQSRTAFTEDIARRGIAGKSALDQLAAVEPLVRAQVTKAIEKKRAETVASAKEKVNKDWEAKALGQAEIDEQTAAKNTETLDKDIARLEGERTKLAGAASSREGRVGAIDKKLTDLEKERRASTSGNNYGKMKEGFGFPGGKNPRSTKDVDREMQALRMERHQLLKGQSMGLKEWDEKNASKLEGLKSEREKYANINPETRADRARGIATSQLGIEAPLATGKINTKDTSFATKPAPDDATLIKKAGLKDAKELGALRQSEGYQKVSGNLTSWVQNGVTKEQFLAALRTEPTLTKNGAFDAKLYNLLVSEVANLFPSSASLRSMNQGTE